MPKRREDLTPAVAAARGRRAHVLAQISAEPLVLAAMLLVCLAALLGYGEYQPAALAALVAAIGLLTLALGRGDSVAAPRWVWAVAVVGAAALSLFSLDRLPGVSWQLCVPLIAGAAGTALLGPARLGLLCLAAAVGCEVAMLVAGWTWGSSPIDVFAVLQAGSHQLLVGANPYGVLIPVTPYTGYTGPVAAPFVYGPAAAIIDVPARALGDVRLVHALLAVLLCATVSIMVRHAPPPRRMAISALALLLPLTLPMIHFAWVDLPAMALFAWWLLLRPDHRWVAAIALGLSLAAKPSALPALLVMLAWLPQARRDIAAGVVLAAVVVAPFAVVTGPAAFFRDVVSNLADQPPRLDSLTVDAFLHANSLPLLPGVLGVALAAALTVLVIAFRRPSGVPECLVRGAVIATVGFLFAKVAYLNYYYTAAVFLLLALAMTEAARERVSLPLAAHRSARQRPSTYSGETA